MAIVVVLLLGAGGCGVFCPPPGRLQDIGCGSVLLRWPACRKLKVVEHTCRRDRLNHLVVRVRFRNKSDAPYSGDIRVEFRDEEGRAEAGSENLDRHEFAPGTGAAIEWTSRSDAAVSYVVEVSGGSPWPW